ncbi:unnamed protein product [Linum tenue]|uniref:CRAL/TRIO N-terminal domain-containing protein n=1 Tax=Linum tenue TaxID=586396 RepID=A0AAV0H0C9_9ROSI|nr:unnamed protein product [Linum tenue]CAI0378746.1 unnamed protein product [Linum tenue]
MGMANQEAIKQFQSLMDKVDEPLKNSFKNVHQGFLTETLTRFLKAREWNVAKAHKMGLPVIAVGVGQSTYDKASVHYYVQSHIQMNEYRDRVVLIMDVNSLPHFCKQRGSGSSRVVAAANGTTTTTNCYSLDHAFHQQLYNYVKQQAEQEESYSRLLKQGSVHVNFPAPDPEGAMIATRIESELHKLGDSNGFNNSFSRLQVNGM